MISHQEDDLDETSVQLILDQTFKSFLLRSVFQQSSHELQTMKYTKILAFSLTRIYGPKYLMKKIPQDLITDRIFIKECLGQFGLFIREMPVEFKDDFEFGLAAVKSEGDSYRFLSEKLKKNRIVALKALESGGGELVKEIFEMNEEFCRDEQMIYEAVKIKPVNLTFAHEDLRRNFDFALKCVKLNGNCIRFVDVSLKTNEELVTRAVLKEPSILEITPLVKEVNFVLNCIKKKVYPKFLKYLKAHNNNELIVTELVKKNGLELEYAHDSIKSFNETIVMIAVNQDGRALEFVKPPLLDSELINLTAIRNHPLALEFTLEKFKSDYDIVKSAVDQNLDALKFASLQVQQQLTTNLPQQVDNEQDIWIPRVGIDFWMRKHQSIGSSKEVIYGKIRNLTKFHSLRYEELEKARCDEDIMLEAIKNDDDFAISLIESDYSTNEAFIRKAIRINKKCLKYAKNFLYMRDFILDTCSIYSIKDFDNVKE
ncbi:predicted protein [Naegleria gruberi]|uniref:Predicted protein n=1 Tax=Naegleria gruberi TaxID=5762 RepID=D2VR74_NAEGR|nr:uncharacterized protein NAEGRDRAFT_71486 [Naegleria gruberi]EFC40625.1 predicted protein [Naegleria gruberi]|eukprot:XP_002673369.1 predicted protein [Naegleria gruberi strain NEG-M]